ncbi:hypothetical protein MLD38_035994 [Melastoma candidum]|uniref:Uncharacterized protein n=1 Tax=Melastoma candidum TaxID=119954 RepID=A0ACB9LIZ5_9MYRT|nr:hypothetical protein MLD38_035994 [Melastoma candidum]
MAAADSGSGPRYAPEDPTLPKPWKGLIDGSTGNLYYWNPETSVTQYEKPAAFPPLHQGPPPQAGGVTSTAPLPQQMSSLPASVQGAQLNGLISQLGQHVNPSSLGLQQQGNSLLQHQGQSQQQLPGSVGQVSFQTQYSQYGQSVPQPGSYETQQIGVQMMQHMTQSSLLQSGQQMQHQQHQQQQQQQSGQPIPHQQPGQLMPQQHQQQQSLGPPMPHQHQHQQSLGQSMSHKHFEPGSQQISKVPPHSAPQVGFSQPHQFPQRQMTHHQVPSHQEQHGSHEQGPISLPAQVLDKHREYKAKDEEADLPQFNYSQFQQNSVPPSQNLPTGPGSGQIPHMGASPGKFKPFGGFPVSLQQSNAVPQYQQPLPDPAKQNRGPSFSNQMGAPMMQSQQPSMSPGGSRMGFEDNLRGRPSSEYYFNDHKEGPLVSPQHPKLAPIPMARNAQDMKLSGLPQQNIPHRHATGFNSPPAHMLSNTHGPPTAPTAFASNIPPPNQYLGPSGFPALPSAEAYCQQNEVTVMGDNVPAPFMTFEATRFPPEILRDMNAAGFAAPTPIQAQTWPIALQSRDIVAIAKTGSGKTLGYLIPAFMLLRVQRNNPRNGPTVLVLAPTRELATQIQDEAMKFGRSSGVSCTCLYGGAPKGPQLRELERGADIVVATPGRLNDILETKQIDLRQVSLFVLDEADRMLDMGFEPQIRKVVNELPPRRQTLMYTATWPKEVRKIASDLLVNPVQVNIGSVDELVANKSITQHVEVVPQMEKQRRLEHILRSQERGAKVIIFCSTKRLCDQLARSIGRNFGAVAIHGDKSQGERDWALNQFRTGRNTVLVATDVAARGLDIKDIRVVINYDFPTGIEDYVHRIGRTGRAGATGVSYTFFCEQDWKYATDLIKVLEGAEQHVPPQLREMASRGASGYNRDRGRISRFDSDGGVSGHWDSGGRGGMREGNFGGHGGMGGGGMRDGGFGGMRDNNFGGWGGMRDGGFDGRGAGRVGKRDGGFDGRGGGRGGMGARGGRGDFFPGRGGGPRGFSGPLDRYDNMDGRGGYSRGRGRGRFGDRREIANRGRGGGSYGRSPDMVRTWGGRSSSRSRSRSGSRGRSRSRSRSWTRSRSRSRSRSWSKGRSRSYSRSRSRSPSYDRYERRPRVSKFDQRDPSIPLPNTLNTATAPEPDVASANVYSGTNPSIQPTMEQNDSRPEVRGLDPTVLAP